MHHCYNDKLHLIEYKIFIKKKSTCKHMRVDFFIALNPKQHYHLASTHFCCWALLRNVHAKMRLIL